MDCRRHGTAPYLPAESAELRGPHVRRLNQERENASHAAIKQRKDIRSDHRANVFPAAMTKVNGYECSAARIPRLDDKFSDDRPPIGGKSGR